MEQRSLDKKKEENDEETEKEVEDKGKNHEVPDGEWKRRETQEHQAPSCGCACKLLSKHRYLFPLVVSYDLQGTTVRVYNLY